MRQFLTNKLVFGLSVHGRMPRAQAFEYCWRRRTMAGGRRRILVVEDDLETAEQLVDSLATNGYQVDLAVDGDDGLKRGRSAEYAVMVIDRMLPGIDGLAVIQRLREHAVATPALIISALG